jgi:hypothetical protein
VTTEALEKLPVDAIYHRRMIPNTCLQRNLAAQELKEESAEALPVIERLLQREVLPKISDVARHVDRFLGLKNLLGAYMVIASRHDVVRGIEFLHSLPLVLQAIAVGLIPLYFRKEECRPIERLSNDTKPMPHERLLSLIKDAARSHDPDLRKNAAWSVSFYPSIVASGDT